MGRLTPTSLALGLLVAAAALLPLNALAPAPPPHVLTGMEWLRLLVGMPAVLFAPGAPLAALLLRRDLRAGDSLSLLWTLAAGLALQVGIHALHYNALRLLGVPIGWPALAALMTVETSVAAVLLRRRGDRFAPWDGSFTRAAATVLLLVTLFAVSKLPHLTRDGSWYFWNPAIQMDWDAVEDRGAIELKWSDGRDFEPGVPFARTGRVMGLQITNNAPSPQRVPIALLLHGPIGAAMQVNVGDFLLGRDMIAQLVVTDWSPHPVERYWKWGSASVVAQIDVAPGDTATVDIVILPPESDRQPEADDTWLTAWAKISGGELVDAMAGLGHHHMAPGQLLNVTENVRWADEIATDFVLPGRSPDGSSTLHQPPAWTYLYSPARELLTRQNASASALLLCILLAIPLLGLRAIADGGGRVGPLLGGVLALGALQHGRLMVADGSMNFPDSLYALAVLVAALTLVGGRGRLFVLWALLAALLRYPGAVVVAFSGICLLALDRERRRKVTAALVRFGLAIALFCGVMLLVGLLAGRLDTWFFALYFETIPEHFRNNPEALPILRRPLEFLRIWALVGGGVILLGLPFRGRLAKVCLGTAVLYAPFLAFIDHFSHHYFLPLIALVGVAAAASISEVEDDRRRRGLAGAALLVAVGLFALATRWNI